MTTATESPPSSRAVPMVTAINHLGHTIRDIAVSEPGTPRSWGWSAPLSNHTGPATATPS